MCKATPILSWLMQFLLEQRCEGSKNKMADILGVDRQTIRRAFRRTEIDNARVTPMMAEQIILYFFEHRNALETVLIEYSTRAVEEFTCPMSGMVEGWLHDQLQGSTNVPQYSDMIKLMVSLEESLNCTNQMVNKAEDRRGHYCRKYARCPLIQLVEFYNRYLVGNQVS